MRPALFAVVALTLAPAAARAGVDPPSERDPLFERDVRPILKAACFHCHGEEEHPKGKLDLRLVSLMKKGGSTGPAVVPGHPDESTLWERVESDDMPEGPKKLTAAQKDILRRWIASGAKTARPEPADPKLARFTAEELGHWAFQPVRPVAVPQGCGPHPVDAFLLAKLKTHHLGFSPEADRATLIRRVTFDLLGLPPTPEEVEAFAKDGAPGAWERVVDRLLASPHYGERWGRHWLDVAGYAESDGGMPLDKVRPHAWRYRDYVVKSINADKPYDQFIREQLAGDELGPTPKPGDAAGIERLTATGFLRMAPDVTDASEAVVDRNQAVADTLKVVGSSVLGLTVGCAQCHDHRYDPVGIDDYYRFRAVFDPAFDIRRWTEPSERKLDVTPEADAKKRDAIEAQAKAKLDELRKQAEERAAVIQGEELAKLPKDEREILAPALKLDEKKRTPAQVALTKKYPNIRTVSDTADNIELYDKPLFDKQAKVKEEVEKLRATKPPVAELMVVGEQERELPVSRVLHRGDVEQPKEAVKPGEIGALRQHRPTLTIPEKDPTLPTSGRRLAYARWATDPAHPLTARVAVNRAWMHHFGRGIVATPGEFGLNGARPSHPELLDWLAAKFVADGWSQKKLHRLILTSAAYRQVSRRAPALDRIDADNALVGRYSVRRLDAESVRDALLSVSGKLNREVGGPSVPVTEDYEGRGVLGERELSIFGKPYGDLKAVTDGRQYRRSLYVNQTRTMPLSMLEAFDAPVMIPNCDARKSSTVPPQSLMMLNDAYVVQVSEDLTERLWADLPDQPARLERLFRLLYGVEPTAAERKACEDFVARQRAYFAVNGDAGWLAQQKKYPHGADMRALSSLCQTLLSANRFLYVD